MYGMVEAKPFSLFAKASVVYNGRAFSTLEHGNYLIIYKNDNTVSIHGGDLITPRNYMGSNSKLTIDGNKLVFTRKKETVTITIDKILYLNYLDDWSYSKIIIRRTEKELARKIYDNWKSYFNDEFDDVVFEFPTPLGPIDLAGFTKTTDYIVEVKRRVASLKDVTQLRRYVEALEIREKLCKAYLAAPGISKKALTYLEKHQLYFLQVEFDEFNDLDK